MLRGQAAVAALGGPAAMAALRGELHGRRRRPSVRLLKRRMTAQSPAAAVLTSCWRGPRGACQRSLRSAAAPTVLHAPEFPRPVAVRVGKLLCKHADDVSALSKARL